MNHFAYDWAVFYMIGLFCGRVLWRLRVSLPPDVPEGKEEKP